MMLYADKSKSNISKVSELTLLKLFSDILIEDNSPETLIYINAFVLCTSRKVLSVISRVPLSLFTVIKLKLYAWRLSLKAKLLKYELVLESRASFYMIDA